MSNPLSKLSPPVLTSQARRGRRAGHRRRGRRSTRWASKTSGCESLALLGLLAWRWVLFFTSESGKQLIAYGQDSVKEVKKVVWPTRKEATQMTLYVFAFVFVMALFLWITDKTLEWALYDLILGWKR
jgi:preprotein translocase SecE subunit